MARPDLRRNDEMRKIKITPNTNMHAEGSVLIELGKTQVICMATVEDDVPMHVKGTGRGWVTAEYSMLPRATNTRSRRDISKLKLGSRSAEIQRLIGRSLRSVVDMEVLRERCIIIDCDVIQADGGTRCASITGGFVALYFACKGLLDSGLISKIPINSHVAAISAGVCNGEAVLDLDYNEDCKAEVDCNIVMTGDGRIIEVQATGEERPFSKLEFEKLLSLGKKGTSRLVTQQKKLTGEF